MRAITLHQPWAWAVMHKGKDIENRGWKTEYRGKLIIHAGRSFIDDARLPRGVRMPDPDQLAYGAVVGVVDLVDVVYESRSKWFYGPIGLVLKNPKRLRRLVRCSGQQSLWIPDEDLIRKVLKGL